MCRAGLIADLHAEFGGPFEQQVDHHRCALSVPRNRDLVPARRWNGQILVGPYLFVARVHQPLGAGLDHRLLRVVAALEVHTEILKPVEMLDAVFAVGADLVVFGVARHRDEVGVHVLDTVGVPGGLLDRGAAAEIEVTPGQRRRAAGHCSPFQYQDPGACGRSGHGRATTADAEADDDDVNLIGVFGHRRSVDGLWNVEPTHQLRISPAGRF